jgi:signal transduction histidine kinase
MSMQVEKPKSSRSLTATLATAFLALSVAVLLIASSFQMYFNFQTQQEVVAGKQQLIAQDAANTVASFIQEKFSILEAAVRFGNPASAPPEEQKRILEHLMGLEPAFRHLVLLDSQEQELVEISRLSQAASGSLVDRAGSDLFSQVKQGNRYTGSVYLDEVTSEPLVIMAVPATNVFGDFQGTLMAEVNLKFMWDLVDRLEIGESGLAYVVDRQGSLIAFGDIARVLRGENVGYLREVGEFISNPAPVDENGASISIGINGTTIVGTYVPLGTPDWAIATELPVAEAYREVVRGTVILAGVMLVMAMLAGLLGVNAARRLAGPLLNLTETATRIAEGEMGLQAAIEGPTEVASLAGAFNSMTAQLQDLIGSLEQRVAERTAELAMANEQLQREVTERKQGGEQLRRYAAELERANEEVRQFAYIVSHDLRVPLTNLKGFSEELVYALEVIGSAMDKALPHLDGKQRRDVTTALREDVPEALGFIGSSVTRMDNFINAVLKLSRLGRRELKFELVDMEALVQVALQTLAHQMEERQVKVTVGSLPEVVADRASMEQILGNLLGNAVKYLDPGRPGEIEVTAERGCDETTFRVRDNGRGIAAEDMDKVFAPFRRAGRQDVPGEGMGLPYVQTLVRRHGGRIWCESEVGVGTVFTFTLSNDLTG